MQVQKSVPRIGSWEGLERLCEQRLTTSTPYWLECKVAPLRFLLNSGPKSVSHAAQGQWLSHVPLCGQAPSLMGHSQAPCFFLWDAVRVS